MMILKNSIILSKNISFFKIINKNKYVLFLFNFFNTNLNISHVSLSNLLNNTQLNSFFISGFQLNSFFFKSDLFKFLKTKYLVIYSNDLNLILNFLKEENYLKLNLTPFTLLFEKKYFVNYTFLIGNKLFLLKNSYKNNYLQILSYFYNFLFLYVILNYISYILQLIKLAVSSKIVNVN